MIHTKTFMLLVVMLFVDLSQVSPLQAQTDVPASTESSSPADDAVDSDVETEEERAPYVFDIGDFEINDFRPTRNVTAKLKFKLHLVFVKPLTESQIEQLKSWKHRVRDQVITSVRVTEMKYFHEPDLTMLSRKILIRVNRLFKVKLAEEVLYTKYMFRTN